MWTVGALISSQKTRPQGCLSQAAALSKPQTLGKHRLLSKGSLSLGLPTQHLCPLRARDHDVCTPTDQSTHSARPQSTQAKAPQPQQVYTHCPHRARSHWLQTAFPSTDLMQDEQGVGVAPGRPVRRKYPGGQHWKDTGRTRGWQAPSFL